MAQKVGSRNRDEGSHQERCDRRSLSAADIEPVDKKAD